MNTALFTVPPNPNKEPGLCTKYHPIFLTNTGIKIISRALDSSYYYLIHPLQTDFIKERHSSNNRMMCNESCKHLSMGNLGTIILFLFAAFREWFLHWITALHHSLNARIITNGLASQNYTGELLSILFCSMLCGQKYVGTDHVWPLSEAFSKET